jgi:hypothetical protein
MMVLIWQAAIDVLNIQVMNTVNTHAVYVIASNW